MEDRKQGISMKPNAGYLRRSIKLMRTSSQTYQKEKHKTKVANYQERER